MHAIIAMTRENHFQVFQTKLTIQLVFPQAIIWKVQTSSVVLPNKTLLFLHHDENQDVVFCNIILC